MKPNSIQIPKDILEEEDLAYLQDRYGSIRTNKDNLVFTREQFEGLLSAIDGSATRVGLSEAGERSFAVRAASKIVNIASAATTPADRAACLAAAIGLYPLAPEISTRLLAVIK